ncbi:uncharacterized protein LOC110237412 [Exaiptasia diaphana]|uniref:Uncharacterized protein n=1 Tax=Exaiptasia diaphana TaxID=2652724 RepID=A0A913X4Z3_EXADI|nr:uncharacterized protein LOC110237412 [Exaiptasia diaphana]
MVKLLLTFIRPLEYAIADEKQPGAIGNLSKELLELRNDLKKFMDIAKDLHSRITGKPFPYQLNSVVTRASLNKKVNFYKKLVNNKMPVDNLRNWKTLDEIKYKLINELLREVYNTKDALNL